MEFWDDEQNQNLHVISLGLTLDEAAELAARIRSIRGKATRSEHKIEFDSGNSKIELYIHPEDVLII